MQPLVQVMDEISKTSKMTWIMVRLYLTKYNTDMVRMGGYWKQICGGMVSIMDIRRGNFGPPMVATAL